MYKHGNKHIPNTGTMLYLKNTLNCKNNTNNFVLNQKNLNKYFNTEYIFVHKTKLFVTYSITYQVGSSDELQSLY